MIGRNLFSALASGAKFSQKKHGDAIKIFSPNSGKAKPITFFDDESSESEDDSETKDTDNTSEMEENHHSNEDSSDSDNDSENVPSRSVRRLETTEDYNEFRNRLQIKVKGQDIPNPVPTFSDLDLEKNFKRVLLQNIENTSWKEPTPIQMQSIPVALLGRDIMASAPTGSGKTASYAIPLLSRVSTLKIAGKKGILGIVLCPTKELADQILRECQRLSTGRKIRMCVLKTSVASTALSSHSKTSLAGFDIIICTPMRLLSVIQAEAIDLSGVEVVVLDEVDKLFDQDSGHSSTQDNQNPEEPDLTRSSFLRQIDQILFACPSSNVQKLLFSATINSSIQELANNVLHRPILISVGKENSGASTIKQRLVFVGREEGKLLAIRQLVQEGLKPPVLLFLQSKDRAKELYKELVYDGINVDVIHSERTPQQREEIIKRFRRGDIWVLICTDLMARGIDFKTVKMVINFDLPQSAVSYIHRIGRTGRAGREGEAITLFTEADMKYIRPIANVVKLSGCEVPDFLLHTKQLTTREKKSLRHKAPERNSLSTRLKCDKQAATKRKQMIEDSKAKKMRKLGSDKEHDE